MSLDRQLSKKFEDIRLESDIARGNCLSCSVEIAYLFMSSVDTKPTTITVENAMYDESEALSEKLNINADDIRRTFTTRSCKEPAEKEVNDNFKSFMDFIKSQDPGTVIIADDDDHVFNIFKSFDSKIYLIDSDSHVYKEVNSIEDFIMPAGTVRNDHDHHYFLSQETIDLYVVGRADESWRQIFKSSLSSTSTKTTSSTSTEEQPLLSNTSTRTSSGTSTGVSKASILFATPKIPSVDAEKTEETPEAESTPAEVEKESQKKAR